MVKLDRVYQKSPLFTVILNVYGHFNIIPNHLDKLVEYIFDIDVNPVRLMQP